MISQNNPSPIDWTGLSFCNTPVVLFSISYKVWYVPIPHIEYTDDSDLVFENLTLQGQNLFPNIREAQNFIKISLYDTIADDYNHHMPLSLHQMQADMRDCILLSKETGIKMSDSGLADVLIWLVRWVGINDGYADIGHTTSGYADIGHTDGGQLIKDCFIF